jgi:hypothetical protein
LAHLSKLPANWDSYGAVPVSVSAIESTLKLLCEVMTDDISMLDIVPTVSGGIQIEWHIVGIDLELEISPDGKRAIYFEDSHGQTPSTEDESRFPEMVAVLRNRIIETNKPTRSKK